MENIKEDSSFQAGYRVAKYLNENPCKNRSAGGTVCADCIAAAVAAAEREAIDEARREKVRDFKRR